jgi:hypothetical protein
MEYPSGLKIGFLKTDFLRMNSLTVYWFPITPPAWGICGLDEGGNLHLNPSIISESCRRNAFKNHALSFLKIGEGFGGPGMVGLVSVRWLKHNSGEPNEMLDEFEALVRKFIANTEGHLCPCADVSLPGDPTFTDAALRVSAGAKN